MLSSICLSAPIFTSPPDSSTLSSPRIVTDLPPIELLALILTVLPPILEPDTVSICELSIASILSRLAILFFRSCKLCCSVTTSLADSNLTLSALIFTSSFASISDPFALTSWFALTLTDLPSILLPTELVKLPST